MNGKVILITGAAGTGKSTLVRMIIHAARPFKRIDYGQLLLEHKARSGGRRMTYDELRRDSGAVITAADVRSVDDWLIEQLPQWRNDGNIIIDSHAVTKEAFGFRITPYSLDQVHRIGFDVILVLVGDPTILAQRVAEDPRGRPAIDRFQAGFQIQLQAGLAVLYAVACGRPCYALETTQVASDAVLQIALDLLARDGVTFERCVNGVQTSGLPDSSRDPPEHQGTGVDSKR